MVGDKGPGGGADLAGGEDRGVHLQKALFVQVSPYLAEDAGPLVEGALHPGVDDQVHIPLAVPGVHVLEAAPLVRQGQQRLGQQHDLLGPDRYLPHLGAEHLPGDPHDVPDVELPVGGVSLLPDDVLADIQLDAAGTVLEVGEAHLAHPPLGHDAPGDGDTGAGGLLILRLGVGGEVRLGPGGQSGHRVFGDGKGVVSLRLEVTEFFPAHPHLLGVHLLAQLLGGLLGTAGGLLHRGVQPLLDILQPFFQIHLSHSSLQKLVF